MLRCLQDSDLYKTDYLYKLFGEQVDRSPKFMRRCVQTICHRKHRLDRTTI